MTLSPGTRLGPYEVAAQIGKGGMGDVYKATDTNLKRAVAIKVLPSSVAGDADRLARFQREAEVLAALNHPNIAAIYGLERSSGMTALVMELVEGPTLADRISQGAIPVDEALPIAKQIAEALDAAHEKGIIHRDLKPANIKLRPDGVVKVLDFGLAKALTPDPVADLANSPTLSFAATQAGMILGTAGYMSPEQAKGRTVDRRTDVWAFGAVLFEMLTGTRAFAGDDISDTLANVLKMEPDWSRLPAEASPRVRLALRGCLQKDPKQRIGDVQSVRLALEGAFETAAPQTTATASSASSGRLAWMAFAVAVLVAAALAIPAVRYLRETSPPETRTEINTPATDQPTSFALSPDGRQVVFVGSGEGTSRLWLRSLATTMAQPLAGTDGATAPFWSPDGRSIAFFAGSALKRLDLGGGAPQTLAPVISGGGGTWGVDGTILFSPRLAQPLMRVSAGGGATTTVTTVGPGLYPQFLPDGRRFLFFASGSGAGGIYLGALDGSGTTRLTPGDASGVYLPSGLGRADASDEGGRLLWVRAGTLVAQRLDVGKAVLTGEPVTLAEGVAVGTFGQSAVSVSATGLMAYRTGGLSQRQLTWVDRTGRATGPIGEADGSLFGPRVSPDARRVVVQRAVAGNTDLWLLEGSRTSRLTFTAATDVRPAWSPDGTGIAFAANPTGVFDLYQKLTNGAVAEERVVASDQIKTPTSWSADGRFLLFNSTDPRTNLDILVVSMVGARTPSPFLKTPFREAHGEFSPDSRWVAYQSNESGRDEVYVRPFVPPLPQPSTNTSGVAGAAAATSGGQWQISTAGGIFPAWRRDGKELYYLNPEGALMAVSITPGATFSPGAPVALFPTRIVGGGLDGGVGRQYDVAPDGRFLINTELDSAAAPITLIQNWNPEAKK